MTAETTAEPELQEIWGRWAYGADFGYDFRGLTVAQARHIAPFVVEAVWSRGLGSFLLIHGGDRAIRAELRRQWRRGDWMAWAYWSGSRRHRTTPTSIELALRPDPQRPSTPLPDLEPGLPAFDEPRCVHHHDDRRRQCGSPAAGGRPYCIQHDPKRGT